MGTLALPGDVDWQKCLGILGLIGAGLAAGRLLANGLYKRYRSLFGFLILRLIYGCIPLIFTDTASKTFEHVYICAQPLIWMSYVLMVRELYTLTLASHKGLRSLGRWAMYVAVAVSVTVSLLSILKKITPRTPQLSKYLGYVFAVDRGVNFALVLFILLILFFLSRYPVPLSRNVVRHSSFLFIYFLTNGAAILLRTIYGRPVSAQMSLMISVVGTLVVFAWLFFITPEGEKTRKVMAIGAEHEEHILRQLDALNATLLKISRN